MPDLVFHLTRLTGSMMIWVGTVSTEENQSSTSVCLTKDWSCAVPPFSSFSAISTQLSSNSPANTFSHSLSQKLAQRFKIQIFLSIDISPELLELEHSMRIQLEKELFIIVKSLESK
ncbi:hypothetical protein BY996DRAFT_4581818 [Phakopsora pachyrhizi]|uniref:Expressed protein n=1 Tax=Phakopsora pachyrhizi TaxID=170000 RepID=A0AAV0ARM7_PHAPC|nr:hypothetical protein BY996DRAFT_4581818 [Phakopsora pachyrhizi]CAH7670280.1 expressed protein [Phakopsora pachyrhizi]